MPTLKITSKLYMEIVRGRYRALARVASFLGYKKRRKIIEIKYKTISMENRGNSIFATPKQKTKKKNPCF